MSNGVEVRGNKIRVYFNYQGNKCREPLPGLIPSEKNIAYATRMVEQIRYEIQYGSFEYDRYFPNSRALTTNSLDHYLDVWLEIAKRKTADSTFRRYYYIVESNIRPKFGAWQANKISYLDLEKWISDDLTEFASKTIKHIFDVLHQVFKLYVRENPGALDPTDGIDIRLPDSEDPDPFARDEIHQILTTPPRHDRHQEINLIQYMMWSGPRPSEAIALAWEDVVDLDKGLVNIRRGNVNGKFRVTKTRRSKRTVELLKPALEALQAQHELTYKQRPIKIQIKDRDNRTIKEEKLRFIFLNTNTGQPHASDFTLRERFFKHHLKIAGVRYRGPANCRHTFISQMLTAGLPIEWIIQQVGHTTPEMIRRVYGKWLNEDAADWRAVAEARLGL